MNSLKSLQLSLAGTAWIATACGLAMTQVSLRAQRGNPLNYS